MNRGFSLIEILIVLGLAGIMVVFAMFVSMDSYRGVNFRNDRSLLIVALQHARAQALSNVCVGTCTNGKSHGVKILNDGSLVIFQGSSYTLRDASLDAIFKMNIATSSGASEFTFSQLTATTSAATTTITDISGHVSTTTVNGEGRIAWTN